MSKRKRQESIALSQNLEAPKCDDHLVHLESVRSTQSQILPTEKAQQMAEVFGLLADANRLRLISVLALKELCVCDLAAVTKMSESAICHQLRLLKAMRLVNYRREGRNVYYSLADGHIVTLYSSLAKHLEEEK
ncbi:MAG: helix-turn-helix transcriptional regulator [Calothrix sp. C42_A2020_038]|nr:helix-turn-helix transcriptional regulator [Calothrix sp. C42_A2020_038]